MTITDADIRTAVTAALGPEAESHDVDAITRAVIDRFGLVDIETVDHDAFWALVAEHAR